MPGKPIPIIFILLLVMSTSVISEVISPPIPHSAPIPDIGPDQRISEGQSVKLDARNSTDLDGNITRYEYDFGDGSSYLFVATPLPRDTILIYTTADESTDNYRKHAFDVDLVNILTSHGYSVTVTDRYETPVLSLSLLSKYGQLWIVNGDFDTKGDFTAREVSLILDFMREGRGLFLIGDHGGMPHEATHDVNQIGQYLGLTFHSIIDQGPNGGPISPVFAPHRVTSGLTEICGHSSAAMMEILAPYEIQVLATLNSMALIAARDDYVGKVLFNNALVRFMNENFEQPLPWVNVADTPQYVRNAADFLAPMGYTKPPLVIHEYGDDGHGSDGIYTVTLTVIDDLNETSQDQMVVTVVNTPPQVSTPEDVLTFEGLPVTLPAVALDNGSDDLTFIWDFGDGSPKEQSTYYNDGMNIDPYPSPGPYYPFTASDARIHDYPATGTYFVNLTVVDDDGGQFLSQIVVNVVPFLPPKNLTTHTEGDDIVLEWLPSPSVGVDEYWVYQGSSPILLDFSFPLVILPSSQLRWRDQGAAAIVGEKYYTVRARNVTHDLRSRTSNSAGKYTKEFQPGLNVFSLPLEPFERRMISDYADEIPNALYVGWLGARGKWVRHHRSMSAGENDTLAEMGKAYTVLVSQASRYTFCGKPAGMINYTETFGASSLFMRSLAATVRGIDVFLYWTSVPGAVGYLVVRSHSREGLFDEVSRHTSYTTITSWSDTGRLSKGNEQYYLVIPVSERGQLGSSTYSLGVFKVEYTAGSDTFSLPLHLSGQRNLDYFCDLIENVSGISYLLGDMWKFHAKNMPSDIYDSDIRLADGFQISIIGQSSVYWTFVGH